MKKEGKDGVKYVIGENDVIFTNDIYDAVSNGLIGTCLHIIVLSGSISFSINDRTVEAYKNDCIIAPNRTLITDVHISDDFTMKCVIVSAKFMRISLPKSNYEITGLLAMANNPVIKMTPNESEQIVEDIIAIEKRHKNISHAYYADMVSRSVEMMVLDMYDIHSRYHSEELTGLDQSAYILRKYIALLQQGLFRKNRKVEYYASLLKITPQYLSECCIKSSGHNASFFIDYFTADEIGRLLKNDELSITEISYKLEFNTTNYFTRYVKRVLGMTPREYRARYKIQEDQMQP